MKEILHAGHRAVLEAFTRSNVLVAFDYDGTLAPIVNEPDRAEMRPLTRRLFEAVTKRYPCAVISGRAEHDVRARLGGAELQAVIGNHGAEGPAPDGRHRGEARSWLPQLERHLGRMPGVVIEEKGYSVAVHYRQAPDGEFARLAIESVATRLEGVRLVGGKSVVNLLPRGAGHKGSALVSQMARSQRDTAVYVGDDETDEDVFSLDQAGWLLGIRVGREHASAAAYVIRTQEEIDDLLAALLELRS